MESIKQALINNANQRLTPELINGLYHTIEQSVAHEVAKRVQEQTASDKAAQEVA